MTFIRTNIIFCIVCGSNKIENNELGLCGSCNKARRDKENEKPKVVKQAKKVSEKRAEELKEYPKKKKEFLEFKMICELNFDGCSRKSTEPHHCSLLAKNFLNTDTWKAACRSCHIICENMPAEKRRELGFLTD